MTTDGELIRSKRSELGMTQEKLAAMSALNTRTVQRAERGEPMSIETLAQIASALNVKTSDLRAGHNEDLDDGNPSANAVVLHKTDSGKVVRDALARSFAGSIDIEIEPTAENVDLVIGLAETVERMAPEPWDVEKFKTGPGPVSQQLRDAVELNALIDELAKLGVYVFVGTYVSSAVKPRMDGDTYDLYTSIRWKPEPVTIYRVRVSDSSVSKIAVPAHDEYPLHRPEPEPAPAADLDDNLPF